MEIHKPDPFVPRAIGERVGRLDLAVSVVDGHGDAAEQRHDGGVRLGAGAEPVHGQTLQAGRLATPTAAKLVPVVEGILRHGGHLIAVLVKLGARVEGEAPEQRVLVGTVDVGAA